MQATRSVLTILTALLLGASIVGSPQGAAAQVKTSKERLSDKAADEQRVDNCRVPVERRGPVPRPGCEDEGRSPAPADARDNARPDRAR
jgi:hypothetical protein